MSTMRLIDTNRETADALAWVALACEELAHEPAIPHPRHGAPELDNVAALHGMSAIAVRVNQARALLTYGVEVLVDAATPAIIPQLHDLHEMHPDHISIMWDSADFPLAYRHGMIVSPVLGDGYDTAVVEAANAIRREALMHATHETLVSSYSTDEFDVRIITPGWAMLQAIAQYAETDRLVAAGALVDEALVTEFRWAASTVVRALTSFPEDCAHAIAELSRAGANPDPLRIRTWPLLVAPMADAFFTTAWERPELLERLPLATEEPGAVRAAITSLANLVGPLPRSFRAPRPENPPFGL